MTTYFPLGAPRPATADARVALPAPVAADLRRLAARTGETPSLVAERLLSAYLDVLDETAGEGGLGSWLDRLFEAEHDPSPRVRMRLDLPAWQLMALRSYAAIELAGPGVVLAAMIGRTLRAALERPEAASLAAAYDGLLAEHRQAA
jgi:hypothetical protein